MATKLDFENAPNVYYYKNGVYMGAASSVVCNGKTLWPTIAKDASYAVATGLTYTGRTLTGVYNLANCSVVSGSATGYLAGTYSVTLRVASGHAWSDGSTDDKTVTWSIARKAVAMPTASSSYATYDGSRHYPYTSGEGYTVVIYYGGTSTTGAYVTEAKNAGYYTFYAVLDSNYCWTGGSTETQSCSYTIYRATITATFRGSTSMYYPTSLWTYNGMTVTAASAGTGYSLSGTYSEADVPQGSYHSYTVTPGSNYQFSDGTTSAKTFYWTISQETQSKPTVKFDTLARGSNIKVAITRDAGHCNIVGKLYRYKTSTGTNPDTRTYNITFNGSGSTVYDLGIKPGSDYNYFLFEVTSVVCTNPSAAYPNWAAWSGHAYTNGGDRKYLAPA